MPTATTPSPVSTTDVLGYFNKNSFPLQITSEHLGVNMQVGSKSYVTDRAGRKINDPRLDFYATSGLLSKEFSKTPVPMVLLAGSPVAGASPDTSVTSRTAAPAPRVPVQGTITPPGMPNKIPAATQQAQPSVSAPGINAMSVAEATRRGIIPRPDRRDHFAKLPNEDKTGEAARTAPSIDSISPAMRPVIPHGLNLQSADVSEAAKLAAADPVAALTAPPGAPIQESANGDVTIPGDLKVSGTVPAVRPAVELDGRLFTTAGNLKRALLKKFNGDRGMADEAFEAFKGKFAPQRVKKA